MDELKQPDDSSVPFQQLGAVPGSAAALLGCEGYEPDDNDNEAEYVPEDPAVLRADFLRLVQKVHQGRFDTTREPETWTMIMVGPSMTMRTLSVSMRMKEGKETPYLLKPSLRRVLGEE